MMIFWSIGWIREVVLNGKNLHSTLTLELIKTFSERWSDVLSRRKIAFTALLEIFLKFTLKSLTACTKRLLNQSLKITQVNMLFFFLLLYQETDNLSLMKNKALHFLAVPRTKGSMLWLPSALAKKKSSSSCLLALTHDMHDSPMVAWVLLGSVFE